MTADMSDMKAILAGVAAGRHLSESEAELAFDIIMSGNATPSQMGGFLMALRVRGETVEEITGAARTMRAMTMSLLPESPLHVRAEHGTRGTDSPHRTRHPQEIPPREGGRLPPTLYQRKPRLLLSRNRGALTQQ